MSDIIPKIIHELNNKNFKKALNLCEKYSGNSLLTLSLACNSKNRYL